MIPDRQGYFGLFGGKFVPETLMSALSSLESEYSRCRRDVSFRKDFRKYLKDYAGRPTMLYFAKRLTEHAGGAKIYLKREDLNHTGAHKINHCIGEALLAKRLKSRPIIIKNGAPGG